MTTIRFGILLYPGAQNSAALGLADLFEIAGRMARTTAQDTPQLQVDLLKEEAVYSTRYSVDFA